MDEHFYLVWAYDGHAPSGVTPVRCDGTCNVPRGHFYYGRLMSSASAQNIGGPGPGKGANVPGEWRSQAPCRPNGPLGVPLTNGWPQPSAHPLTPAEVGWMHAQGALTIL